MEEFGEIVTTHSVTSQVWTLLISRHSGTLSCGDTEDGIDWRCKLDTSGRTSLSGHCVSA
ncbi:hypothetical protein E2C01_060141 [Portunus trituberculatus]|uniref:Uncharacterized protein n=1 Tax=Portunus trituberculatus TaxID=210409 RepID=A0A5B7HAK0_PORTR|nr:hypothetical protein [Portunus trituberculatus]